MRFLVKCPTHHVELICPVCQGKRSGAEGGRTAARRMSTKARKQRAQKAAKARWGKRKT